MKKHIDEVLYSISPDTVVARRYNPILGIGITAVAAVAMLGAGDVEPFASNRDTVPISDDGRILGAHNGH